MLLSLVTKRHQQVLLSVSTQQMLCSVNLRLPPSFEVVDSCNAIFGVVKDLKNKTSQKPINSIFNFKLNFKLNF